MREEEGGKKKKGMQPPEGHRENKQPPHLTLPRLGRCSSRPRWRSREKHTENTALWGNQEGQGEGEGAEEVGKREGVGGGRSDIPTRWENQAEPRMLTGCLFSKENTLDCHIVMLHQSSDCPTPSSSSEISTCEQVQEKKTRFLQDCFRLGAVVGCGGKLSTFHNFPTPFSLSPKISRSDYSVTAVVLQATSFNIITCPDWSVTQDKNTFNFL